MANLKWQLYDEQGRPLTNNGASSEDGLKNALLHGAAHVWMWRLTDHGVELLLQKRAQDKYTWPGRYDISAAGHIDLGEDPLTAAVREAREEIGFDIDEANLRFIGAHRCCVVAPDKSWTENEIRFLYLLQATPDMSFSFDDGEVESVEWMPLDLIKQKIASDPNGAVFVPHGSPYFSILFEALEQAIAKE